jgi:hypothetical protein
VDDGEPLAGAGDGDVGEAALFLELLGVVASSPGREDLLLHPVRTTLTNSSPWPHAPS